jgi:hypothetical protein
MNKLLNTLLPILIQFQICVHIGCNYVLKSEVLIVKIGTLHRWVGDILLHGARQSVFLCFVLFCYVVY